MTGRDDLTRRLPAFIRKNGPYAYCDACLALRLQASLSELLAALATLREDDEFERRRRTCYGCGRTLELTALVDSSQR